MNDYEKEREYPTSANIICDDMEALATIKRDFLGLLEQIEKRVGKPAVTFGVSDAAIAEETFDELMLAEWYRLEQAYHEAPDTEDYDMPDYPKLEQIP